MLANLLPGLRDLRTPLAIGYLWLIGLWLLFHSHLPKNVNEANGPIKSLYELGGMLGTAAILAAFSFVAYLIGSMLTLYIESPPRRLIRAEGFAFYAYPISAPIDPSMLYEQLVTFTRGILRETAPNLTQLEDHKAILPHDIYVDFSYRQQYAKDKTLIVPDAYVTAIADSFPAIAIRLQARNRDFWDTYDRQIAEAQFRFGIMVPIAFNIVILATQSHIYWWLSLLILPVYLYVLGRRQSLIAASTLIQAIVINMVEPPVLERLRQYIAQAGPEQIRHSSESVPSPNPVQEH